MGRQVVLKLTKILVRLVRPRLRGMTTSQGMKMMTLISATMTMMMMISASSTPQPSFHVWAKQSAVEIIPSLRTKRRERRLEVGVVPTLNPLGVEVVVPILHPLEV
jgi:hypothetical protein